MDAPIVITNKSRGANVTQRNQIKELAAQDYTAEEISEVVRVELECVKNFMGVSDEKPEVKEEKPAPKKKVAKKKAAKKD